MQRKNITNFDNVKLRLLQFAESQGIPKGKFYEKISIPSSNFSGKGAESAISSDKIVQILNLFPDLNSDWLLLGRGEMLRSETPKPVVSSSESDKVWKEILADKDRRIEELIIENYKIREQVTHIQAITPPHFAMD